MADQAMDDAAQAAIEDIGTGAIVSDDTSAVAGADSPDASGAIPQDAATTFNPELYSFEHKGQRIIPKDENQVRQWLSGGYNYSQNQSAFKKQQSELEARAAKVAQLEQLNDAFEKNPQFQKQILEWYQKSLNPQQPQQGGVNQPQQQLPPEILKQLEKVDMVSQEVERIKEKEEDAALNQEITNLKSKYGEYDWTSDAGDGNLETQVLKVAMDHGLTDLEKAFKIVTYDKVRTTAEANALKRLAEEKVNATKAGIVSSNASPSQKPVPRQIDHSNVPYNKLAEMAAAEIT